MDRAEQRALEAYPEKLEWDYRDMDYDPNMESRLVIGKATNRRRKI